MYRSNLCWCLVVTSWHRSHTWIPELKVIRVVKCQLGVHLLALLTLRRRDTMGDSVPDVLQSTSASAVQAVTLPKNLEK